MHFLLQVVVSGLAAGCVYGLVAIGHALVSRLTGTVYLALGDVIGLGIFTTLLVAAGTGPVTQTSVASGRFLLALAVGLVVCVVAGAGGYLFAVQPFLQRGSTLGWVGGTLAPAFAIRAAIESSSRARATCFPTSRVPTCVGVGKKGCPSLFYAATRSQGIWVHKLGGHK